MTTTTWPAPGIHEHVPFADYLAFDAVSSTFLKAFRRNPAGALTPIYQTPEMQLGQAIHTWSLEGRKAFEQRFAVLPESDLHKNSNAYKAMKAEFEAWAADKEILPSHYSKVPTEEILRGVDMAFRSHPMASRILASGRQELSLVWEDVDTGMLCKARLDHDPGNGVVVDLKKTASVDRFKSQIVQLSYDVQAAFYVMGADACGLEPDTFVFLAVEAAPPYPVLCGYLDAEWLEWARGECRRLLGLVKQCDLRDEWPAYRIPQHVDILEELTPESLMEEWQMPPWR